MIMEYWNNAIDLPGSHYKHLLQAVKRFTESPCNWTKQDCHRQDGTLEGDICEFDLCFAAVSSRHPNHSHRLATMLCISSSQGPPQVHLQIRDRRSLSWSVSDE